MFGLERTVRPSKLTTQLAQQVSWIGGLAPTVHLAQTAPLVEAAAQLLRGGVGVGVQHDRCRHERLGVARAQHVDRQHPILGVGHLAKRHAAPMPRGPRTRWRR